MAGEERDVEFLERLKSMRGYPQTEWAEDQLRLMKHYGIYEEMRDYVVSHPDYDGSDINVRRIMAFRCKPNRVVWTEDEFREKVREGVVSEYDVIRMADGYVPPQGMFA